MLLMEWMELGEEEREDVSGNEGRLADVVRL